MIASTSCAVCGGPLAARAAVRLHSAVLGVCRECGSWSYSPRMPADALDGFYDSAEYFEHPYLQLRRRRLDSAARRWRGIVARLSPIVSAERLRGARMLDVGCDRGTLLQHARDSNGIVPFGIDLAGQPLREAAAAGLPVVQTTLEAAPADLKDLDIITAIDVIEHVPSPRAFMAQVAARLSPRGVAYVETPNLRSSPLGVGRAIANVTLGRPRRLIDRLFPVEHLQYFTPEGLRRLAGCVDLDVVASGTRPIPLGEIAVSPSLRVVLGGLMVLDQLRGEGLILWAIVRGYRGRG